MDDLRYVRPLVVAWAVFLVAGIVYFSAVAIANG
jgi:hypothetical protein